MFLKWFIPLSIFDNIWKKVMSYMHFTLVVCKYISFVIKHRLVYYRDGTGSPGHGSPGHRFWPGHGSMCQTRCLTRFWVLTCAFIVALFLQCITNSPSRQTNIHGFGFRLVPVTALVVYLFQSLPVIFTYLRADCPRDVIDVVQATDRVGSGLVI